MYVYIKLISTLLLMKAGFFYKLQVHGGLN